MSGDSEPEDAWHPDDPLLVLVDNLTRRAGILGAKRPPFYGPLRDRVDELFDLLELLRRNGRPDADSLWATRLAMFAEDLDHVRHRLHRDG